MAPIATLTVRLSAQIAEFQQQFQSATRTTQQFQNTFQQTATRAAAVGSLIGNTLAGHVNRLGGEIINLVAQGQKLSSVERSFDSLTASIRQSGDEMRGALREGTRGLVADIDLLQAANKAILLGLPVTTAEMGDLAKTATVLGKAMGQDATKSLDDLITALGRSSPLILDNLGLTVKVGEANEAYARKLGKTVESMTEAEKKTAFYNAAMEAARRKVQELGDQTTTLADLTDRAWVRVSNAVTQAASIFNNQVGKILTRKDDFLNFIALMQGLGSPGAALVAMQEVDDIRARNASRRDINLPLESTAKDVKAIGDAAAVARPKIDAYLESIRDLARELSGAKLRGEVRLLNDAWRSLTDEQRRSQDVIDRTAERAMRLMNEGAQLTGELFQLTLQTGRFYDELLPVERGLGNLADQFPDVTRNVQASADELIDLIEILNHPILRGTRGLAGLNLDAVSDNVTGIVTAIPAPEPRDLRQWELLGDVIQDISGEVRGLGGVWGDVTSQALSNLARVVAAGKVTAAALRGIATASIYGLLIDRALAFVDALNPPTVSNQQRDDLFNQFGGRAGLNLAAQMAGLSTVGIDFALERNRGELFAQEAARLTAAIEAQQEAMERYNLTWRDFGQEVRQAQVVLSASGLLRDFTNLTRAGVSTDRAIDGMSDSLNQLIIDAVRTGTRIPGALQPMLRTLIESRQISEDAARALLGIADTGMPALADITAAAERYGLTLDQLGPKVQQLRIDEEAKQIVADFKLLEQAGADVTVVAVAMKDRIQDIVTTSFRTGAEVPAALRPIIQILVDMGLLVDANGQKLNDINDINFGKDLVSAVDALIDKLGELIDTLLNVRDLQDDIANGFRPRDPSNPPIGGAIPRPPGGTTPSPGTSPDPDNPGARPNPNLSFSGDTATQSAVAFAGGVIDTGGAISPTTTIVVDIDGRTAASAVVPYIPGEVQRLGLA